MSLFDFIAAEASFQGDKAQWEAQTAWQEYSNTMANLSNSMNQNAVTTNEILANQAFANKAVQIKQGSLITQARVDTAAAAAGVKGRTVNQAMRDVQRNAANRESERQMSFTNANLAFDQQRVQSSMSAAMQQDYTYLPKPSRASYYLEATMKTIGEAASAMGVPGGGSGGSVGSKAPGQKSFKSSFMGPPAPAGSGSQYEIMANGRTINWNGVRVKI